VSWWTALAERLGAPVLTTIKAKGLVPDVHPLGAGVIGRSGTPVASWLMNESDLLLVIGASFSNHTGVAAYKPIVQVDDDHAAVGRFHPVTAAVLGDTERTLDALITALDQAGPVQAEDQRGTAPDRHRADVGQDGVEGPAELRCRRRSHRLPIAPDHAVGAQTAPPG
jgi:thiamine pyrophosphate-dependent acetolactate synthase large subunit-like protein